MPMRGNGPTPKISSGFSTMSSATEKSRKQNGVFESPAPRSTIITNV